MGTTSFGRWVLMQSYLLFTACGVQPADARDPSIGETHRAIISAVVDHLVDVKSQDYKQFIWTGNDWTKFDPGSPARTDEELAKLADARAMQEYADTIALERELELNLVRNWMLDEGIKIEEPLQVSEYRNGQRIDWRDLEKPSGFLTTDVELSQGDVAVVVQVSSSVSKKYPSQLRSLAPRGVVKSANGSMVVTFLFMPRRTTGGVEDFDDLSFRPVEVIDRRLSLSQLLGLPRRPQVNNRLGYELELTFKPAEDVVDAAWLLHAVGNYSDIFNGDAAKLALVSALKTRREHTFESGSDVHAHFERTLISQSRLEASRAPPEIRTKLDALAKVEIQKVVVRPFRWPRHR